MFWKFNFLESTSHIDTLLGNEDVTLHELMDEDDILQECKAQNKKLIDFVSQPDQMMTMIDLIVKEPDDPQDEQLKYKYSNTACDVLTSDVVQINDQLILQEHLVKLYNFLELDDPLNPLLASFFSKVMGVLIARKSELIFEYLRDKDDFVGTLLRHIGTSAIMDLLLRLITCIEEAQIRLDVITWLNEQKLVEKLVSRIVHTECEEVHCNASQSLCDIIRISRDRMSHLQEKADPDPLLATIESREMVSEILNNMLSGERSESCLVNGLAVLQNLLEFRKSNVEGEPLTALDTERISMSVQNVLDAVQPRLADLHSIFSQPPKQHYSLMHTTFGRLDPPLGNTRIQAVRLMNSLISTNMHEINVELSTLGTVKLIMDLFFTYEWNNFLHSQVEQCVVTILRNPVVVVDEQNQNPLLSQLILEYKILDKIIDAWEDNENSQKQNSGQRKGYMGHLTRIANDIVDLLNIKDKSEEESGLSEYAAELSSDDLARWDKFTSGSLAELNNLSVLDTVPTNTMPSSNSDEDDDSFKNIPFQQDTALQQLRQMTTNFIDQVGFNEEEFLEQEAKADAFFSNRVSSIDFTQHAENEDNSPQKPSSHTIFERALESRVQQFDDDSDEEDIWEEKEMIFSDTAQQQRDRLFSTKQDSTKDEDSSDSEEDLESESVIKQQGTTENMDVDSTENIAELNNPGDLVIAPIAMDTGNPWDSTNDPDTTSQNWATFSTTSTTTNGDTSAPSWADFSAVTSITDDMSHSPTVADSTNDDFVDFSCFKPNAAEDSPQENISSTETSTIMNGSGDANNTVSMATDDVITSTSPPQNKCPVPTAQLISPVKNEPSHDLMSDNFDSHLTNERLTAHNHMSHDADTPTQSCDSTTSPIVDKSIKSEVTSTDQPMTTAPTETSQNGPV